MWVGNIQFTEGPNRIKGGGRVNFPSFCLSREIHFSSSAWDISAGSQAFTLTWGFTSWVPASHTPPPSHCSTYTTSFPGSLVSDGRSWDFSASITMWADSYNESVCVCACVCLYTYIYTNIHTHAYICTHKYTHICMYLYIHTHICINKGKINIP